MVLCFFCSYFQNTEDSNQLFVYIFTFYQSCLLSFESNCIFFFQCEFTYFSCCAFDFVIPSSVTLRFLFVWHCSVLLRLTRVIFLYYLCRKHVLDLNLRCLRVFTWNINTLVSFRINKWLSAWKKILVFYFVFLVVQEATLTEFLNKTVMVYAANLFRS